MGHRTTQGGEFGFAPPRSAALWSAATPSISAVVCNGQGRQVQVAGGTGAFAAAVVVFHDPGYEERAGMGEQPHGIALFAGNVAPFPVAG